MKKNPGITRRQFLKTTGSLSLLALAPPLLTSCSTSTRELDYSWTIETTRAYIEKSMAENNVVGAAIGLVDGQRLVWAEGFGYADLENKVPATPDTLFGIGSTSKTFAAAIILQLVDRGLVRLDDPLTEYIPHFSLGAPLASYASTGGPITIRRMLTQHSGIPGELMGPLSIFSQVPDVQRYSKEMIDYLRRDHAQYPTDYFFAYSNMGVALLADVVEAVTGMSFTEYSNDFLRSLGMKHSSFDRDDPSVAFGQTINYIKDQAYFDGYVNPLAAGSMLSSVSDMAKYIQMINAGGIAESGRVLTPGSFEAMLTPQNIKVPLDFDFRIGFMWWLVDPDLAYAGAVCHHGGDTLLSHTQLEILLDHKLGVVVLTNTHSGAMIKNKVALKALQSAVEEKAGLEPPAVTLVYSPAASFVREEELDAVTGIYIPVPEGYLCVGALTASQYDRIERAGNALTWIRNAGSSNPLVKTLVPLANGRFSSPDSPEAEYEFQTVSGRNVMVRRHNGFRSLCADRYDPVRNPSWEARVGTYTILNLDPNETVRTYPGFSERDYDLTLRMKDGLLLFEEVPLAPVSDTKAYRPGLARNLGSAVTIVSVNGEEQLQYCGCLYRRAV